MRILYGWHGVSAVPGILLEISLMLRNLLKWCLPLLPLAPQTSHVSIL